MKADPSQELGIMQRFAAGSLAGVCAQSAIYPMEASRIQLALKRQSIHSVRSIYWYIPAAACSRKLFWVTGLSSEINTVWLGYYVIASGQIGDTGENFGKLPRCSWHGVILFSLSCDKLWFVTLVVYVSIKRWEQNHLWKILDWFL